jgi:hypothetical protein
MEHAKKFVLVDPQMYRPSLPEKSLSVLDHEIRTTLNSDLPDDQKAKLYSATLKKFKSYDNSTKPPEPKPSVETELTDSLPPILQYKAKKLLRLIKDNPDIDWTDKGELIYKQSLIPKSHVSDLFGDALAVKRSADGPIGWEEFDDVLDSSNVPHSLAKRHAKKELVKKFDEDSLYLSKRQQRKRDKIAEKWIKN